MQIRKREVNFIVFIIFLIFFTKNGFAALVPESLLTNFTKLYADQLYGWLDFFIYFLIFTSIARLTLEKKFGENSPAVKPLYIALGLALSVALTLWTTTNGISFLTLGPAALVILAIGLGAIMYQWLQTNKTKGGEHKAIGIGFWLILLIILLAFLLIYPDLFGNFIPGISSRDIWILLLILGIILGIWLLIKWLGGKGTESKDTSKLKIPPWLKWVLLAILIIILLYFLGPYILAYWWIPVIILLAILLLYLLSKLGIKKAKDWLQNRRAMRNQPPPNVPPTQQKINKIKKVSIIILPDNKGKPYIQGNKIKIKLIPNVQGGSGNFIFTWFVEDYKLKQAHDQQQEIEIDLFTITKNSEKKIIRLWVSDQATNQTVNTYQKISIGKGINQPPNQSNTQQPQTSQVKLNIIKPWKSKVLEQRPENSTLELQAEVLGYKTIDKIIWGLKQGIIRTDLDNEIKSQIIIGTTQKIVDIGRFYFLYKSKKRVTQRINYIMKEQPGNYTIFCSAIDKTGAILTIDIIFLEIIKPQTSQVKLNIKSPRGTVNQKDIINLEAETTPPLTKGQYEYKWKVMKK